MNEQTITNLSSEKLKLILPQKWASILEERAATAERRATVAEERSIAAEKRAVTAEEGKMASDSRATLYEERAISAEARAASAEERATAAEQRAISAEGKAITTLEERTRKAENGACVSDNRIAELVQTNTALEGRATTAELQIRDLSAQCQHLQEQLDEPNAPSWVLKKDDIVFSDKELGRGGWGIVMAARSVDWTMLLSSFMEQSYLPTTSSCS